MAQNVTIAGASYTDVPSIEVPKTEGGSAKFIDTSDANATASDIYIGKSAYVNGVKIIGTGSEGGSYKTINTESYKNFQVMRGTDSSSISNMYIRPNSEAVDPTLFFYDISGENLFDINDILEGCELDGTGDVMTNENWFTSGPIRVEYGEKYVKNFGGGQMISMFDSSFNFIGNMFYDDNDCFTIENSDAAYVLVDGDLSIKEVFSIFKIYDSKYITISGTFNSDTEHAVNPDITTYLGGTYMVCDVPFKLNVTMDGFEAGKWYMYNIL